MLADPLEGMPAVPLQCYSPQVFSSLSQLLKYNVVGGPAMEDIEGSPVRTGLADSVVRFMYSQLWGGLDTPSAHALLQSPLPSELIQAIASGSCTHPPPLHLSESIVFNTRVHVHICRYYRSS